MPKGWDDPDGSRAREREKKALEELRERHEYWERKFDEVKKRQINDTKAKLQRERNDIAAFVLAIGLLVGAVLFLVAGVVALNLFLVAIGGTLFIVWLILLAVAGHSQTGHYDYYYIWGASRGRIWRMSSVHRATRG